MINLCTFNNITVCDGFVLTNNTITADATHENALSAIAPIPNAKGFRPQHPSSLSRLWIFCIFMQKIPIIGATYAVCKVYKFTSMNLYTILR
jgi:hypothetical protein